MKTQSMLNDDQIGDNFIHVICDNIQNYESIYIFISYYFFNIDFFLIIFLIFRLLYIKSII